MSYYSSRRRTRLLSPKAGCSICGVSLRSNRVALSFLGERTIFCEVHVKHHAKPINREAILSRLPQEKLVYAFSTLPPRAEES
jgi:hypothetical protein